MENEDTKEEEKDVGGHQEISPVNLSCTLTHPEERAMGNQTDDAIVEKFRSIRIPTWLKMLSMKSVASPLLSCFALSSIYTVFHFYIAVIYLTKNNVGLNQLALIFLGVITLRLVIYPVSYFLLNSWKKSRESMKNHFIILFGFLASISFGFLWHPMNPTYIGLQLCLAVVCLEVSVECLISELSRTFEAHYLILKNSAQLAWLIEIIFTSGVLIILVVQFFTNNATLLIGFEVACLVVAIVAFGSFLISYIFYPNSVSVLKKGRRAISNVSQLSREISDRITSVVHSPTKSGEKETNKDSLLCLLSRFMTDPQFICPLIGKAARQARIAFNTVFLYLFVQLFLMTFERFSETGFGVNFYFVACLTVHLIITKLLLTTLRDSGPAVVNIMLALLSLASNILILIFGRSIYFFTICYIFFENVLSRACSQATYAMLQTRFVENMSKDQSNRKLISRRRLAFIGNLVSGSTEYFVLAIALIILNYSSRDLQNFLQNSAPLAVKCEQTIIDTTDMAIKYNNTNDAHFFNLLSQSASATHLILNISAQPDNITSDETKSARREKRNANDINDSSVEKEDKHRSQLEAKTKRLCDHMVDVTFVLVVLISTSLASIELLAMNLLRRHSKWTIDKSSRSSRQSSFSFH
ncbi:hypothetical protein DdX_11433 [Ditylenchus destructor]|uniref:Uncharacterized protein n=1 Tax=Ditylenchus destructor TaxID=166010 RepID=A0AAD4R4Q4_9BILA|nr:hypothetical protein DdX_11433 [Ditylenchus destructor]